MVILISSYVGQAFMIEQQVIQKKSGKTSCEIAYGNTSQAGCDATTINILRTIGVLKIAATIF
jgi:hypothetical protein